MKDYSFQAKTTQNFLLIEQGDWMDWNEEWREK